MKPFMDQDFLLETDTARRLYHDVAAKMPIFDFHCHLNPMEIYEDNLYQNLYELWLQHDHYKWRAMRAAGVEERLITGDGEAYEKYLAWAAVLEDCIGNPLYHWTHLELQHYFGICEPLDRETAPDIWVRSNRVIAEKQLSPCKLLAMQNVTHLCTTDDIADGLEAHRLLAKHPRGLSVYPTFRFDPLLELNGSEFSHYLQRLSAGNVFPEGLDALFALLDRKVEEYHRQGCRTADHGLPYLPCQPVSPGEADGIYRRQLAGKALSPDEKDCFRTALLEHLFRRYRQKNWVAQIHIGSLKNGRSAMKRSAVGCDSMHDMPVAEPMSRFFDRLDRENMLPRILIFNINPTQNYTLATLGVNFSSDEVPGKVQLGTAWWLMDHRDGMEEQIKTFANCGVLASCVGMLTDSRSFLSYTRHEYYRRILCNLLGKWVENGEYGGNPRRLEHLVEQICYRNALRFFSVEK